MKVRLMDIEITLSNNVKIFRVEKANRHANLAE